MGTHFLQNALMGLIVAMLLIMISIPGIPARPARAYVEGTPTMGNPTPTVPDFAGPLYGNPPTSMPDVDLPNIDGMPTPPPAPTYAAPVFSTPDLPEIVLPTAITATMAAIDTTVNLSYSTPDAISSSANLTSTEAVSQVVDMLLSTQNTISGIVSYTNNLSNTIYQIGLATDTLATGNAPEWYAPALPRPVADVGWRFEEMAQDVRKRYSVAAWGLWTAEAAALPIQLIKSLAPFAQLLGPFGLFLAWLLIMFPVVLVFKILKFLKNFAIQIFNFLFELIKFLISFIPGVG